jgi:hypothetical protein
MASSQIQTFTEFSASNVEFSKLRKNKHGGNVIYLTGPSASKLRFQFPKMRAPFGLSNFVDKEKGTPSYSLDLSFDDDPEINKVRKVLEEIDAKVVQFVSDNSQEFLKKKMSTQLINDAMLYKPLVRVATKEGFAPTCHMGLMCSNGKFQAEAYNIKRKPMKFEDLEKGQKVVCIADISSIYFINGKFGVTMRLQQCVAVPSEKLKAFAFVGLDDEIAAAASASEGEEEETEEEAAAEEEEDFDDGGSDQASV